MPVLYIVLSAGTMLLMWGGIFWMITRLNKREQKRRQMGYGGGRSDKRYPELKTAPRRLNSGVKLGLLFGKRSVQFYWLWLICALIGLFIVIYLNRGYIQILKGKTVPSTGFVTSINKVRESSKGTPTYYYKVGFQHTVSGKQIFSSCRLPTSKNPVKPSLQRRDSVTLVHSVDFPKAAEIRSINDCQAGKIYYFLIPGGIGAIFIIILIFVFFNYQKVCSLLSRGRLTYGTLIKNEYRGGKNPSWDLLFEYLHEGRPYRHQLTLSSEKDVALLTDDQQEALLYHPDQPDQATMFDHLGGYLTISERGEIISTTKATPIFLLLPLIAGALFIGCAGLLLTV